jgi:hypothetical protein
MRNALWVTEGAMTGDDQGWAEGAGMVNVLISAKSSPTLSNFGMLRLGLLILITVHVPFT